MENNSAPKWSMSKGPHLAAIGTLSEAAIRRQLLSDAVQHPATLLPLAVVTSSGIYLLLLPPVFGAALWAIVFLGVSSIAAASSFAWRYAFRYTEQYARRVHEVMDILVLERARLDQAEMGHLREALQSEFVSIEWTEGTKVLSGLVSEYERLQPALRSPTDTGPLSMSHIPALAQETYRRGLNIVSDALELMRAVHTPDGVRLETEIAELEKEVETSNRDGRRSERLGIKEARLLSLREKLELHNHLQLRVDQMLFQAERCEASLFSARIEIAAIKSGRSNSSVDSVVAALQRTIELVKEVQEELTGLGY